MRVSDLACVLVTDRRLVPGGEDVAAWIAQRAREHGATAVLLRETDLPDEGVVDLARRLGERLDGPLVLAHRPDLAARAGAAGVNLGWRSPSLEEARGLVPAGTWLGASVHGVAEGRARAAEGADFLVLGPVRPTPSKAGLVEPVGFDALAALAAATPVPVVAIGGLGPRDAARVRAAGAAGLAAIRSLMTRAPAG